MATAYLQMIMNEASDPPVNMKSPAYCLRLKLRLDFVMFTPSLYYLLGGSSASLGSSMASERRVTIRCKYAGIGVLASYVFRKTKL